MPRYDHGNRGTPAIFNCLEAKTEGDNYSGNEEEATDHVGPLRKLIMMGGIQEVDEAVFD